MRQLRRINPLTRVGGGWRVEASLGKIPKLWHLPTGLKPTINEHSIFTCRYILKAPTSFSPFALPHISPRFSFLIKFLPHHSFFVEILFFKISFQDRYSLCSLSQGYPLFAIYRNMRFSLFSHSFLFWRKLGHKIWRGKLTCRMK